MAGIIETLSNTVPISMFNRGLAGRVFEDVKQSGAKVVMRNNAPECVLISPEEYIRMNEELNDAKLLALAMERLANYDPKEGISAEELYQELGITEESMEGIEVEFE